MTRLCPECFGNAGLKRRIVELRPDAPNERCSFHPRFKGVPVEEVAGVIDDVFRQNYWFAEQEWDGEGGDSLESIIYELTGADAHEVVRAVIDQLVEADDYDPRDGSEPF